MVNGLELLVVSHLLGNSFPLYFQVIAGLWVLSVVGNWCNFLTLFYIGKDFLTLLVIFVNNIYLLEFDTNLLFEKNSVCRATHGTGAL